MSSAAPAGPEQRIAPVAGIRGTIENVVRSVRSPVVARTLTVEGMTCDHCEQTVEAALEGVDGVEEAIADRDTERVTVACDADPDSLVTAVEDSGYEARV